MPQTTAYRPTPTSPTKHPEPQAADTTASDATNELLDEIDEVLAEEESFAVNYRAKGGQ